MGDGTKARLSVRQAGARQALFVCRGAGNGSVKAVARSAYEQIATELASRGMEIFHERIFGDLAVHDQVMAERREALAARGVNASTPVTYVQGAPPWGAGLAGVVVHAVSATDPKSAIWTIEDDGRPCGRVFTSEGVTYLMLQAVGGTMARNVDRSLQADTALVRIERLLHEHGASFHHVVRTWFYLSSILEWYGAFNAVRNKRYAAFDLMPSPQTPILTLPASTGIGADNPGGSACAVDVLAVVPSKDNRPEITQLSNPGQKDAFRYGAAFSRGALIRQPEGALIELSGTAAIDETGTSLYPGDIRAQIDCTFDKIETLLDQQGAKLADVGAATVFVKRPEFADVFWQMARDRGLGEFPGVCVVADICRAELLFEIDAEVAIPLRSGWQRPA